MRFALSVLTFLFFLISKGQDFKPGTAASSMTCVDADRLCLKFFNQYIQNNNLDSASIVVNYWQSRCDYSDLLTQAQLLLQMHKQEPIGELIDEDLFQFMIITRESTKFDRPLEFDSTGNFLVANEKDQLHFLFNEIKKKINRGTDEYLIADFFDGDTDSTFILLKTNEYAHTKLAVMRELEIQEVKEIPHTHIAGIAGIWIPNGRLELLGAHPEIGISAGVKHHKINIDGVISLAFLKSPNSYEFYNINTDLIESSRDFLSYTFGGQFGYDVLKRKNKEVQLIAGLALDGLHFVTEDLENEIEGVAANSINFNYGISFRYYLPQKNYIGFALKYNLVNYARSDIIDYTGDVISIQFSFGIIDTSEQDYYLNKMR